MILALLSLLLSGLASFAMLWLFLAWVPRLAGDGKSIGSWLLQWVLIVSVVMPASVTAIFGPSWLYEVAFSRETTKDHRYWLIVSGLVVLALCILTALRSAAGKRYSLWRTGKGAEHFCGV